MAAKITNCEQIFYGVRLDIDCSLLALAMLAGETLSERGPSRQCSRSNSGPSYSVMSIKIRGSCGDRAYRHHDSEQLNIGTGLNDVLRSKLCKLAPSWGNQPLSGVPAAFFRRGPVVGLVGYGIECRPEQTVAMCSGTACRGIMGKWHPPRPLNAGSGSVAGLVEAVLALVNHHHSVAENAALC